MTTSCFFSCFLQELTPIHYLRNYVTVTEPRQHLYNLIYQRYRILENPTGKFITLKVRFMLVLRLNAYILAIYDFKTNFREILNSNFTKFLIVVAKSFNRGPWSSILRQRNCPTSNFIFEPGS